MITPPEASDFGRDWIAAWNSHDIDRILAHYSEGVVFFSPFVYKLTGSDGPVAGKQDLRSYFSQALAAYPDLCFVLREVLAGVTGVTILYVSMGGRNAAETMLFNGNRQVCTVFAHYGEF